MRSPAARVLFVSAMVLGSGVAAVAQGVVEEIDRLLPWDGAAGGEVGEALALSGSYAALGTPAADDLGAATGAVYTFDGCGPDWSPGRRLVASDAAAGARFGASVALDGGRLVVGAMHAAGAFAANGAAYVFERAPSGDWVEVAKLIAWDATAADGYFGRSVAVDGDLIAVSANSFSLSNVRAVYLFRRVAGVFQPLVKLQPSDPPNAFTFGATLSLSGGRLAVGGPSAGSPSIFGHGVVYVFEESGGVWGEVARLVDPASNLSEGYGTSVALDGDRLAVGAPRKDVPGSFGEGRVFVYTRTGSGWAETAQLPTGPPIGGEPHIGTSVGLEGSRIVALAPGAATPTAHGEVLVFDLVGAQWIAGPTLRSSAGSAADLQDAVAFDGGRVLSGADPSASLEPIVLAFDVDADDAPCSCADPLPIHETQVLVPAAAATLDFAGIRVAADPAVVAVSATGEDQGGFFDTGVVHVFEPQPSGLAQTAALSSNPLVPGANLGIDVDVDGGVIIAGTRVERAFLFEKVQGSWTQVTRLVPPFSPTPIQYGQSVGISGDLVVVGARVESSAGPGNGAVFVYERTAGSWHPVATLHASDAASGGLLFGVSVAVDGDRIAAAGRSKTLSGDYATSVYVFDRVPPGPGGAWVEVARREVPFTESSIGAGNPEIQVEGPVVALAQSWDDSQAPDAGRVDVFLESGGAWTHDATLRSEELEPGTRFGSGLALDDGRLVIAALGEDDGDAFDAGVVHVFERGAQGWARTATAERGDGGFSSLADVALHGDHLIAGDLGDATAGAFAGAALSFDLRFRHYGCACPGSGGFRPTLRASGAPTAGGSVTLEVADALGGATGLLFLGPGPAAIPAGFGCSLLVAPLYPIQLPFAVSGPGPGAGTWSATLPVPLGAIGPIALQAWVLDGGAPLGAAASNGVAFTFE